MRCLWPLLLIILLPASIGATVAQVEADTDRIIGVGPRDDGSGGEELVFDLVAARLSELGLEYSVSSLTQAGDRDAGGHSFSDNLYTYIPGSVPGRIILASPVDGGAFGTAFLLEMASYLQINKPRHSIHIAFLGAERGEPPLHPYGGRQAIKDLIATEDGDESLLIYIDSESIPAYWRIRPGGNGRLSPDWLIDSLTGILSSRFVPYRLRGADIQLARLGLQGDLEALTPWLNAGISAISFSGRGEASGGDRFRRIERLRDSLVDLDAGLDTIPAYSQSSFLFVRPLRDVTPRIVPELPFVAGFLIVSAILLISILLRYRDVTLNIRRFASRLWAWPLLMMLVFLFFFLSTLFVEETLLLADFPELWRHAPGTFLFFKLSITLALSLNFVLITRGLPLPRSPHFYSYTAILTAALGSLVFMAVDITLAGYSVLAVFFLLLFTATRKLRWKAFFLFLSIFPYLTGIVVIVGEPYTVLIRVLLTDRITANAILTLILMPAILAVISLSYWRQHYDRTRRSVLTPSATLILSISAFITLAWILNLSPYNQENLQPVQLVDSIDIARGRRRLQVSSNAPIGDAVLSLGGATYPLEGLGREAEVRTSLERIPLAVSQQSRKFLGRRTVEVTISGETDPGQVSLTLESPEAFTLHDCDFPFIQSADGTMATVFVGRHPPFPLNFSFTVNGDARLSMNCTASWENPEDPPEIRGSELVAYSSRIAHTTVEIN